MGGNDKRKSANSSVSRADKRRTGAADAILDAAESLFGRHGTEGVSLRQIAVAAGSANHSAVQYYFQNKEGLMRGIFERRLESLELARAALLAQARDSRSDNDTRALLAALLRPIADEKDSSGRCSFAAFLLGLRLFGDIGEWSNYSAGARVTREIDTLLRTRLEALQLQDPRSRMLSAIATFLIAVIDWDRGITGGDSRTAEARDAYLDSMLDAVAAGLEAGKLTC